jgi:hypothetical protein
VNTYGTEIWEHAFEADPRIPALLDAATGLVGSTDAFEHTPDHVYTDAKRFVKYLVGWSRGRLPSLGSSGPSINVPVLQSVVDRPFEPDPDQVEFLESALAFDHVCNELYGRLCDTYDRKRSNV